jgi:glycosyltransferase involved in cell wall biosynthesis
MRKKHPPTLALVIPCYNEEEILPHTHNALQRLYDDLLEENAISSQSFILFVDDGSFDATWSLITEYHHASSTIKGIKLSKNEGHQHALLAGMQWVLGKCDCMISLDADLQDDPNLITQMLQHYQTGDEVVLAVRNDRSEDSFFKRLSAEGYYKMMHRMGVNIEFNHADYRLLSHKALGFFLQFKERNLFIRGIVKLVGLQTSRVYFKRHQRLHGESKYPLGKMLALAWSGITSFSVVPLKLITLLGFMIFIVSIIAGLDALYVVAFTDQAIPGWASTVLPIYFVGGIELLALGIIGEYIGKIYTEIKQRPLYFIETEVA